MNRWEQEIADRLAGLNLQPAREAEIVEELAQHLDQRYRDLVSGGASPDEAHRSVKAELKEGDSLATELSRIENRIDYEPVVPGARRKHMLRDLWQDFPYALRMLRKNPGFTAVAVLSLALGIGANTAIFSLINTVLLRPLPVKNPGQLVSLNNTGDNHAFPAFSYPNYKDLRDRNDVFSDLIAYRFTPLSLSHDGINERVWGYEISGNYFKALGVSAARGRLISPDDDAAPGASPVAVLSYKAWKQRFGGEDTVVGRSIVVNGRSYAIIGVAPQGFFGTEVIAAPDLWFPVSMQAQLENGSGWLDSRRVENLFVQGRLRSGVSATQAQIALTEIARQLEREYPDDNEGKGVSLVTPGLFGGAMRGPVLGFSGLLMIVVGLVLLLACINLANLLLARATERRREIAVRLAMGASRFRLLRQLLTESVLLACAGGALGFFLALRLVGLVAAFKIPIEIPVAMNLAIDYRVFIFACAISLGTGVLFGLLPAWQATKTDLVSALKDEVSFGGYRRSRLKNTLIVAQVALSLVLLVGGGLMLRALGQAQTIKLGFTPERAIEVSFDLRLQGYDDARGREFQRRLIERVRALPGVESAALADMAPVDLHFPRTGVFIEGQAPRREASTPSAMINRATPGYFQAMDTRLVRGRDFDERDDDKAPPVVIINETFARRFWPDQDPIGKRLGLGAADSTKREVIGVVEDGKYAGLNEDPKPFVARPLWQSYSGSTIVIVRTAADPQQLIGLVRSEVQQLDPNIPLESRTLAERMDLPLLPARIAASVLGGFGLLALALVAIGIYGVMSYAVAKRTREIGIRMALGAKQSDVLTLIVRQGFALIAGGMAIGSAAALALTQSMKALLFGISPTDPLTFVAVAVLLAGVALVACYLPARRAAKVDPMIALRYE